ncbi:BZ3500_MvSof-1268-A1-R1_Chr3-1g05977 [Microbotryum saponariae]|uniref:BZ3500_MvSof-1268-A1-R1_Chr3-1g05977 protein n=1 Tax=Microbotryum saponariae TaxID=289078 RepID=A0A2X0LST8_9BASI|nr:BZ3500_MvSof-1268-A1-R1_Chr3-1g05977 [Microbotryum saponariae]SDA05167.1 BZ3501_MvSof-1269-A2-R1_Chr3-1g05647 [Microbotryum saponariae]
MFSTLFESLKDSFTLHAEEAKDVAEVVSSSAEAGGEADEDKAEAAEEEEEPEDEAPAIRDACAEKPCGTYKHHFDHCQKRVQAGQTMIEGENCVEELFHLMHCVEDCAAPKIFAKLK